jgi:hypothetical protein
MIGLATDDLAAEWMRLKAADVEFVEDPTNLVQLLQPARGRLPGAR